MGRGRVVRPQLIATERFAMRTDGAARLYLGLLSLVDDAGNCPAGPTYLRGQVFYGRPRSNTVIGRLLGELENARLIDLYRVDGAPFLSIIGWSEKTAPTYQRIDKPQPPQFPLPTSVRSWNEFAERSETKGKGRQGEGEGKANADDACPDDGVPLDPPTSLSAQRPGSARPPAPTSDEDQISELPDDWQPNEAHRALAAARGLEIVDVARKFREKHTRGRRTRTEWDRYFATWLEHEYPDRTSKPLRFKHEDAPPPIPAWHTAGGRT